MVKRILLQFLLIPQGFQESKIGNDFVGDLFMKDYFLHR